MVVETKPIEKLKIPAYISVIVTTIAILFFVLWVFVLNKEITTEMYTTQLVPLLILLVILGIITYILWSAYTGRWYNA